MAGSNMFSSLRSMVYIISFSFILTTILVINGVKRYNENIYSVTYKTNIQKIHEGILIMTSTGTDYFYSPMYIADGNKIDYEKTSGTFLNTYFELKKYCGQSYKECFANKYKDENKKIFSPDFSGACAILNNGTSICITPQIGEENITGIMDMNAQRGPNVLGKDLREFQIPARKFFVGRKRISESKIIEAGH